MPSSRRRFVRIVAAGGLLSFGGCVADGSETGADTETTANRATAATPETTTTVDTPTATTTESPTAESETTADTELPSYERTRGPSASVEGSQTFSQDDVEYLEETDEIRYVAYLSSSGEGETREPLYSTVSFERWADIKCGEVAVQRVRDAVITALGDLGHSSIAVVATGERTDNPVIEVRYKTLLSRSGYIESQPTISFERLVSASPASATATVTLEAVETVTQSFEVWVDDWTIQQG